MQEGDAHQLRKRVELLIEDVGRLRRRLDPETSSLSHVGDRIAGHVHALYWLTEPTAAELVAFHAPGDQDAIQAAIKHVAARERQLIGRLGGRL